MILSPPDRIAAMRAAGVWPDLCFGELLERNAARQPLREAIVDPPNRPEVTGSAARRILWAELQQSVLRLAGWLRHHGIEADQVVLMQMANTWEQLAVYLACFEIGAIVSPVPALYREHELGLIARQTEAVAFVTNRRIGSTDHLALAERVAAGSPSLRTLIIEGEIDGCESRSCHTLPLGSMLHTDPADRAADAAACRPCADDVVTIVWTSGSEGRPKGVPRSHAQWLASLDTIADACRMGDGVRLLSARPLVTHGAMHGTIMPWLSRCGTAVLHQPFSLELYTRQLRDESIGFTSIAPAILVSLLSRPELLAGVDFTRLSTIGSGSAPLSPAVIEEFEHRFGARVVNFFGSTEGVSLASTPQDVPDPAQRATLFPRLGADGYDWDYPLVPGLQTRLVDPATEQPIETAGAPGELRIRGPVVFDGYFRDPELTARAFDAEGFYRSGDLFELAGERCEYFRYVGRIKDIIVRGGFNISAVEVESLIAAYPGVKEVGVIGMPDPRLGERACAFVAMRPEQPAPSLEALTRFMREEQHVSKLKLPEQLVIVEALPRNANTKVDKARLRAMLDAA
jgi:acyl-CoA synthetase (AMP-forming)/AMP-acid ligase II